MARFFVFWLAQKCKWLAGWPIVVCSGVVILAHLATARQGVGGWKHNNAKRTASTLGVQPISVYRSTLMREASVQL